MKLWTHVSIKNNLLKVSLVTQRATAKSFHTLALAPITPDIHTGFHFQKIYNLFKNQCNYCNLYL